MERLGVSDFPFWGKRTYVQSSHLTEAFLRLWEESGRPPLVRLAADFRAPVRENVDFLLLDRPDETPALAYFRARTAEGEVLVGLAPNGRPVRRTLADDEAALAAHMQVDAAARAGSMPAPDPGRIIGAMVALTKQVHLAALPREGYGQWFVLGLELDMVALRQGAGKPVAVHMEREMGGRMTRTRLRLGESPAGTLSFFREAARD